MAKINFGVIGNPVEHSMSPEIHTYFAAQHNINNFSYKKILSKESSLKEDINNFFLNDGLGLNITIPFKFLACDICSKLDVTAKQCGSVNTLKIHNKEIIGYSTDGIGFIDDLKDKKIDFLNSNVLIIGAGGSAMSICNSFLNSSSSVNISILNRTLSNSEKLISFFNHRKMEIHDKKKTYDLIINTTPISMTNEEVSLPRDILDNNPICYDLFYSKDVTSFQKWAYSNGITKCYDGLGMLIQQAKHSFFIWNGLTSETNNLEKKLRIS